MKKYFLHSLMIAAVMLGMTACSGNDDSEELKIPQDQQELQEDQQKQEEEQQGKEQEEQQGDNENPDGTEVKANAVTVVDANGEMSDDHAFSVIDENSFYVDDIKYTSDEGKLSVTGYDKSVFKGEAKIIKALYYNDNRMDVSEIGKDAFKDCGVLSSVVIPEGVTTISTEAFQACRDLTSITLPEGVTNIASGAFMFCSNLTSITFPESLTTIGDFVFHGCFSLSSVTIPENVTSIGLCAFADCRGLVSVTINCPTVDLWFEGLQALKEVNLGPKVTTLKDGAFDMCRSLTTINIPESLTSIGEDAFHECRSLASITLPKNVESIGERAFTECSGLKDFYCYAEKLPSTPNTTFNLTPVSGITLHVPASAVEAYKATQPWSKFGQIVAIEE